MTSSALDQASGRPTAARRDSQETRRRLVDGIGTYAAEHGRPPGRLVDVAEHVGLSTATAYRYFASLDDLASAHLARLPEHAVASFERSRSQTGAPAERLHAWNRAWVRASLRYGSTTVPLRSARGFLRRRAEGDPLVGYVCGHLEPLLAACDGAVDVGVAVGVAVWNVVSDPREVVDLRETLGWSPERIARHITRLTLAAMTR